MDALLGQAFMWILSLFGWLAGAMGTLMGATLYYTVVRMGDLVGHFTSIQVAWSVFRDIGNIALIFGFMAIGIATILDNATYGAKKALASLLLVAITLNFSLFVAEFIVDTGNMFATQFYAQMYGSAGMPSSFDVSTEPVTNHIMTNLGLTKLYDFKNDQATQAAQAGSAAQGHWFFTFFAGMLLFAITALVFGAIAIMLIARFVILLFLFIASPIGFLGLADIPMVKEYGKKWWKALTDQTIFAPVMMLLLLVVVKVASEPQLFALAGGGSAQDAASVFTGAGAGQVANLLLSFSIIIGLLIASLVIAKSLSGKAAEFAMEKSGKVVFGSLGWLGRNTAGKGLQLASGKFRETKLARNTLVGRRIATTLDYGAKASFDVRGAKVAGSGLKAAGISLGTAQKGGYRAEKDAWVKQQAEYAKTLKLTAEEKKEQEGIKTDASKVRDEGGKIAESLEKEQKRRAETHEARLEDMKAMYAEEMADISKQIEEKQADIKADMVTGADSTDHARELKELEKIREDLETNHTVDLGSKGYEQKTFEAAQTRSENALKEVRTSIKNAEAEVKNAEAQLKSNQKAQEAYATNLSSKKDAAATHAQTGAAIGAAIGTAIAPGIGTAIGGAIAGSIGGAVFGRKFGSARHNEAAAKIRAAAKGPSKEEQALKKIIEERLKEMPKSEEKKEEKSS
ncbi:MAG TPA: hypothetical protein VF829_02755 [Candidatus Paceibacterota bacterium]